MGKFIVIIDDAEDILNLVSLHLKKSGFDVKGFSNPQKFLKFIEKNIPDLIILDLMLPKIDGIEICKQLKNSSTFSNIPIIMLTAKASETDVVLGLELGADDYITKPFSPRELVARVKAVLRRNDVVTQSNSQKQNIIKIGKIKVDMDKYEAFVGREKIDLTPTELRILSILMKGKGRVFTRDTLLEHLWGGDKIVIDRTIDTHIRNIRKKLGKAGNIIKNVRGIGYKIEE